jgi:phosphoribosylformimino-5-aminoimidazole carboxamide ribonucleotide (ProFAR) isomerase
MALVYSRHPLSGSTNGRPIEIATVATPGTTLHTVQATGTDAREEVHMYVANRATATMPVTIEFGGTATTDQILAQIPAQAGLDLVTPGLSLTATTSIVRGFTTGTATDAIAVLGWVNRAS